MGRWCGGPRGWGRLFGLEDGPDGLEGPLDVVCLVAVEGRHLGPVEEGIVAGLVPGKDIDVSHVSWKGFQCGQK